jgi:hypothetical protein
MTTVNGDTVITMTMKQLLAGVVAAALLLIGGIWGVTAFTLGNMRDDVANIRTALTETQGLNANTHQTSTTADGELRSQLASLTAELKITNASLGMLSSSMSGLDASVKSVDQRLAASVARQEGFERWVVTRLGAATPTPASLPVEWQKAESGIVDALSTEHEPLTGWFKAMSQP